MDLVNFASIRQMIASEPSIASPIAAIQSTPAKHPSTPGRKRYQNWEGRGFGGRKKEGEKESKTEKEESETEEYERQDEKEERRKGKQKERGKGIKRRR